jgi:hypothetical protein
MDKRVYRDPEIFYPERYLPQPHGNAEPFFDGVFGYGRRFVRCGLFDVLTDESTGYALDDI